MQQSINRFLNSFTKLYRVVQIFNNNLLLVTFFSVVLLTLSQLFLIMAYLLPIKILILLSIEEVPEILTVISYGLKRESIILFLSFLVLIMYCIHLVLEKVIHLLIEKSFRVLSDGDNKSIKDVFLKRFLENFFRLMATFLLVFLLFCILVYIFPIIAITLFIYLLLIAMIFFSLRIPKEKVIKFFHISFFLGFIIIFIYEVIYLLYYDTDKLSIIIILVSIVIVRYIFLRGVFIVSKVLVVFRDLNVFYKKLKSYE